MRGEHCKVQSSQTGKAWSQQGHFNTFQYKQADLDALDLKKFITVQTAAAPIAHRFLQVSVAGLKWDMT